MTTHPTVQHIDEPTVNMMRRWCSMWERCYLPENPGYEYYGARGICVCQEWIDFQSFYSFWGNPPFENATMGRINNDGDYLIKVNYNLNTNNEDNIEYYIIK